ncbi:hypothetical protein HHI36_000702 [Cryptolaemus montrouzieri]|uniref:Uncharacterized protein n=1 Tax=Cryptolaemus montrouzieri TaxID=559131 RepID=A0ABD2P5Y3_9CUCU
MKTTSVLKEKAKKQCGKKDQFLQLQNQGKNIVRIFHCPKDSIRNITGEKSAFEKIFTYDIIDNIIDCRSKEIAEMRQKYDKENDAENVTKNKFMTFIGLLYTIDIVYKKYSEVVWVPIVSFLLAAVRIDDKLTRITKKKLIGGSPINLRWFHVKTTIH